MNNKKIIIDTDPGIDDAMAIVFLSKIKEIEIEGITTVDGNVNLEHTTENACFIRELINRKDIKIYKGESHPIYIQTEDGGDVHGKNGLGGCDYKPQELSVENKTAVDFLIHSVKNNPKEITILTLGPLTNIAKAVQKDSKFVENVKELVIMGGAENGGNFTPEAEFNFAHDPHAADIVLKAGFKSIVMIGLDVTRKVVSSPNERELMKQIPTDEAQFIYNITRSYMDFWFNRDRTVGFQLCDPMAAMYLVKPEIFTLIDAKVKVVTEGICEGCSVVYRKEIYKDNSINAKVAIDINTKKALKKLFYNLFPEYKSDFKKLINKEYRK